MEIGESLAQGCKVTRKEKSMTTVGGAPTVDGTEEETVNTVDVPLLGTEEIADLQDLFGSNGDVSFDSAIPTDISVREDLMSHEKLPSCACKREVKPVAFIGACIHRFVVAGADPNTALAKACVLLALAIHIIIYGLVGAEECIYSASDMIKCGLVNEVTPPKAETFSGGHWTGVTNKAGIFLIPVKGLVTLITLMIVNFRSELESFKKVAVNILCIVAGNLFKSNHHYLEDDREKMAKLLDSSGCASFLRSKGVRIDRAADLAKLLRILTHPIKMHLKWRVLANNTMDKLHMQRARGFGSGNAKAAIIAEIVRIAAIDAAINLYLGNLSKRLQTTFHVVKAIHSNASDPNVSVKFCQNAGALTQNKEQFVDLAQLIEEVPATLVKGITDYVGGTLKNQKTFNNDQVDGPKAALISKNLRELGEALAGKNQTDYTGVLLALCKAAKEDAAREEPTQFSLTASLIQDAPIDRSDDNPIANRFLRLYGEEKDKNEVSAAPDVGEEAVITPEDEVEEGVAGAHESAGSAGDAP